MVREADHWMKHTCGECIWLNQTYDLDEGFCTLYTECYGFEALERPKSRMACPDMIPLRNRLSGR